MIGSQKPFLTANWRYLAMLNYEVDPDVLRPRVPPGTELDTFEGRTMASMVGFLFEDMSMPWLPIPILRSFEEINLRFYVRRKDPETGEWRRGVVFVREVVPHWPIAWVARKYYEEPYVARRCGHTIIKYPEAPGVPCIVRYGWRTGRRWAVLRFHTPTKLRTAAPRLPEPGSEEEFITEHYWGYTARSDGSTSEYRVEHPPWRVWSSPYAWFDCDVAAFYGPEFAGAITRYPRSAFLAEGSEVTVYKGQKI